jgi:hypothetical protein
MPGSAATEAGRALLGDARCWCDWHTGRKNIERRVAAGVAAIEAELLSASEARVAALTEALRKAATFWHGAAPLLLNGTAGYVHNGRIEQCPDRDCAAFRAALATTPPPHTEPGETT